MGRSQAVAINCYFIIIDFISFPTNFLLFIYSLYDVGNQWNLNDY